ncbi:hypothetical protein [Limnospira platensis]|nr:hypothetical protein [Arthrospira platensis NCB002]WAK73827.1 hypothetical protein AP9108_35600 [Arthrospira sp. PCC 9108]
MSFPKKELIKLFCKQAIASRLFSKPGRCDRLYLQLFKVPPG